MIGTNEWYLLVPFDLWLRKAIKFVILETNGNVKCERKEALFCFVGLHM